MTAHPPRAVVTGATAGLGLATARVLASAGLQVIMVVRDIDRGLATQRTIERDDPVYPPLLVRADLADLAQVRRAAAEIVDGGAVDVLVNNAGVSMPGPRRTTTQGLEWHMAVNHLAHVLLTAGLVPALGRAERPRVVWVTSLAHLVVGAVEPSLGSVERRWFRGTRAYAQSKLASGVFGIELARRAARAGSPLVSVVTHPGWTATALFRPTGRVSPIRRLIDVVGPAVAMSPEQGAQSQIQAALDPDVRNGTYLGPRYELVGAPRVMTVPGSLADPVAGRLVWQRSLELTGAVLHLDQP